MTVDILQETADLLTYLEKRGLTERESCAILGSAVESLINDPSAAREFVRVLANHLRVADELRYLQ
jgi:hypothetical protein